jgi:hypothetical protein
MPAGWRLTEGSEQEASFKFDIFAKRVRWEDCLEGGRVHPVCLSLYWSNCTTLQRHRSGKRTACLERTLAIEIGGLFALLLFVAQES